MPASPDHASPAARPSFNPHPSWRIFRIMSEFVEGFEFLARIPQSVTIFGSSRLPAAHPFYQLARQLGQRLVTAGYAVVTGGGSGIMEASNLGAYEAGGGSFGLNIQLPLEQVVNPYVRQSISFHYFFSRKVMLDFSADAFVFFPGGFGTLDEFFELITLIQTGKMHRAVPIVLIGSTFWQPLLTWMEQSMLEQLQVIAPGDLRLWTLTDDLETALRTIEAGSQALAAERMAATGHTTPTPDEKLLQATDPMTGSAQ